MIFSTKKKPAALDISETSGLDKDGVDRVIREGQEKVDRLHKLAGATTGPKAGKKVEGLAILAQKIIDDLKEQPGDIKRARQFLNYYLDNHHQDSRAFHRNQRQKTCSRPRWPLPWKKVESMLDSIHAVFEKASFAGLMQDDILDLDTELTLLQNTLKWRNDQ